jgi:hypothetical protein
LTDTLLQFLKAKGVRSESIYAILNRHISLEGVSKKEAEIMLKIKINVSIPYLGTNFGFANSQHIPFTIKFPNDTATLIFNESAREMAALAHSLRNG